MYIVSGLYRHKTFKTPSSPSVRPSSNRLRESLFNICQGLISGAKFLDLFAGSGAIGLEALSRGAMQVTFIEKNKDAILCIQQNIVNFAVKDKTKVLQGDVLAMLDYLEKQQCSFDIIFADPPYATRALKSESFYSEDVIRRIDHSSLLSPGGLLFVEEEFRFQPHIAEHELKQLKLLSNRKIGPAALQEYRS